MNKEEEKKNIKITVEVNKIHSKELEADSAVISYDNNCVLVGKLNPNDLLFNTCLTLHTVYSTINKVVDVSPEAFMEKLYEGMLELLSEPDLVNTDSHIYNKDPFAVDIRELLKQMGENNEKL